MGELAVMLGSPAVSSDTDPLFTSSTSGAGTESECDSAAGELAGAVDDEWVERLGLDYVGRGSQALYPYGSSAVLGQALINVCLLLASALLVLKHA